MGLTGLAAQGANQNLLQLLAQRRMEEQLAQQAELARAQQEIQRASLAQRQQEHGDELGLRREQMGQQAEQFDATRRERRNIEGLQQMNVDRKVYDDEVKQRELGSLVQEMPEGAGRRVVNLRRLGVSNVGADDVMTPDERAGAEDEAVRRTGRMADAQYAAAARHRPPPASSRTEMTPGQALSNTRSLRNDFVRETSSAREVANQFKLMQSSLAAVKAGAAAPGSQGVLVTFQKILDPTSVVRESEYARSGAGLSLLNRMEGQWMRIVEGGANVPVQELEKFVALAEQFARNQAASANATKSQIDAIAQEFGLNPELITRDLSMPDEGGMVRMQAPDGTIKEVPREQVEFFTSRGAKVVQ